MSIWEFRRVEYDATRTESPARVVNDSYDLTATGRSFLHHIDNISLQGWEIIGDKGMIVTFRRRKDTECRWAHRWIWYDTPDGVGLNKTATITFSDLPLCLPGENLLTRLNILARDDWEVVLENFYHNATQRFCVVRRMEHPLSHNIFAVK